jgi:uncharacterized repeat protein (TIGR01451 family)
MRQTLRRCLKVLLAVGLGLAAGCFGVTQNPSYFPHLLPTGDIIPTHARPPGPGYFSDFDPHACRLEVRPLGATDPVQTQHVLIATVYDDKGEPRRHRRVEWMLEGAGNIIEVDEAGFFPGRGYKLDNKYAVSYTSYSEHTITRGNQNPNDDFTIRPGQTWCVITSAVEGDTHVTVYAPEIDNWDRRRVVVSAHWVDAEWALPPPAVNRAGSEHLLATRIFRHTDHQPLAKYRVRYRILDGPPAVLLPSRAQEEVATSDLNGNATVALVQITPQAGVNRIGIEIIRPPDPSAPSGAGIVIGRGETTKEWQAPRVVLNHVGPASVAVGQEMAYTITVANSGQVETQAMTVRGAIPETLQYVRSEPPATVEGPQLTWTLGALGPGQAHTLRTFFRTTRVGEITNCASVVTVEGLRDQKCVTTQVTAPSLKLALTGPAGAAVGAPITYQIAVTNAGTGPATNVGLNARFDPALEHDTKANPLELPLGTLGPGETKNVPLVLTARQPGRLVTRVVAAADSGLRDQAEHTIVATVAQMKVAITGPPVRYVGRPATWDIRVSNAGEVPIANVLLRDRLPPELTFTSATANGQYSEGVVAWNLGSLAAGEERTVQVTATCARLSARAVSVATATADGGLQAQAEAAIEINGLPAFRLELTDTNDPVELGGHEIYHIDVTNQGTLPGNKIQIIAQASKEIRILNANGPAQPQIDGQRLIFPPVDGLPPGQTLHYTVEVETVLAGDARFHVELTSETLREPVIKEESTTIYAPKGGARPPG